jgi:hypothetical membrane protein
MYCRTMMNTFALLSSAVLVNAPGLLGLLLEVAILCIVVWAIVRLLAWAGITIPEPIRIIFIALICIVAVVLLFRALGYAV